MAHSRTLCLVLALASVAQSVLGLPGLRSIISRQDSSIPPQCESTCQPVVTLAPTCPSTPAQCCTQLFQTDYANCLTCVGLADNVTSAGFAVAQKNLDNFTIECSEGGFTLPKLTLPGQNPNRTLSTVSGSHATASASHSQITISNLPLSLSAVSQVTITDLSSSSPASPSATSPPASSASAPANNNNAAQRIEFNWTLALLAACALLYVG